MLAYYIMILTPILVSVLYWLWRKKTRNTEPAKNWAIAVFFAIYFVLLALRHSTIGSDTQRYILIFEHMAQTPWRSVFQYSSNDWGYYLINKILAGFIRNPQLILAIFAALTVIPLGYLYFRESEGPLVSMALFLVFPVFLMLFSGLRQSIAIGLVVPAFYFTKERKLWKFLGITILALLFHHSAFMMLLIYPIYHAKLTPKHLLWLIPCLGLALLFNTSLFSFILRFLEFFLGEDYSTYEMTQTGAYTMIILMALFVAYSFIMPDEEQMDEMTRGFRNFLVLSLFLQLFAPISSLAMRMNYYFIIFIPLLIPRITNRCKWLNVRYLMLIRVAVFLYFVIYFFDKANSMDSLNIYPYIPFWN